MDYEKAYKEALERAKQIEDNPYTAHWDVMKETVEYVFPGLRESENERIREALIKYLDALDDDEIRYGVSFKDMRAWLEKQDEHKKFRDSIQVGDKVTRNQDGMLVNLSQLKRVAKKDEKQGDQNTNTHFPSFDEAQGTPIIKQEEPNSIDKVKSKFHEGNWVVYKNDICQIVKREEGCNKLVTVFGIEKELVNERNLSTAQLWTIQDAKPGDVIAVEPINGDFRYPFVAIYKEGGLDFFNSYYCIGFDGILYEADSGHSIENIHPATKEQRDLLFRKMKEAGYEWDAEHKQLKKIEQKSNDWEPQTGDTFRKKGTTSPTYHLCDKREDGITFGFVENRKVGIAGGEITIFALKNDYELVERPKSIEDVVEEELNRALQTKIEQKPWSEEDENMIEDTIQFIEKGWTDNGKSHLIPWLKSLKGKLQPQPKQEWSKLDNRIEDCIGMCLTDISEKRFDDFKTSLKECLDWLHSLKDRIWYQPTQEWSEEDKRLLGNILFDLEILRKSAGIEKDASLYQDEINWLKSLRPQSQWKPNNAQMASITCAVRKMKESACYDSELVSLLNDLKKLREE